MQGWQIENCVLYLATAATIIGGYYFGAGDHSWFGLVFLFFVNSPKGNKSQDVQTDPANEVKFDA